MSEKYDTAFRRCSSIVEELYTTAWTIILQCGELRLLSMERLGGTDFAPTVSLYNDPESHQ
jgi:hypothetical protein